jgi:hypothetical protein
LKYYDGNVKLRRLRNDLCEDVVSVVTH